MISIEKDKLLIVEGTHEVKFFTVLLRSMKLENIQVINIGGNNFDPIFHSKRDELRELAALGITRDADTNYQRMFTSIVNTLERVNLPSPTLPNSITGVKPKVSIFIFPNNQDIGSLEDLCIASVQNNPCISCIDSYFTCLNNINPAIGLSHPHLSKARVQVFLAKEEEGDIHMGIGAEKGCWDFNNSVFNPIKSFLNSLYVS